MQDGPRMARPSFVSWLPGGRQDFPNDPVADRARHERLKKEGRVTTRRIPQNKEAV
jgi:hypothetical protein